MALPPDPRLAGRTLAVLGLARTGMSAVGHGLRSAARVLAWDSAEPRRAEALRRFPQVVLEPLGDTLPPGLDRLILSPGIPLNTHPVAAAAAAAGLVPEGDIALFDSLRPLLPPHRLVAITGTNGKSTVTALVAHLLTALGVTARAEGNIGAPVLDGGPLPPGGVHVVELSSFQIDLLPRLAADVVVFTNLTPDHLDRYAGVDAYFEAKARLFALQPDGTPAIVGTGDAYGRALADRLAHRLDLRRVPPPPDAAGPPPSPALAGPHNAHNLALALAAVEALGLDRGAAVQAARGFAGLPHRMQPLGQVRGVCFVNDSKATNAASAAPALAAFDRLHWIAGGRAKTDSLGPCAGALAGVLSAWLIGEAAPAFARWLTDRGAAFPVYQADTLEAAVAGAFAAARPGDTVLLSPAAASFDQFRDFEDRGDRFCALVERLAETGA